jgi:glycosyltransferase involved in cell wall biosynthesis
MRGLKKYCADFKAEFVEDPAIANVVITNDVFPAAVLGLEKPLVKRMDGVFWDDGYSRNDPLNAAAQLADHVIFISDYSRQSYFRMYNQPLKHWSTVLNEVDDKIFFQDQKTHLTGFHWAASASNWARPEKRFLDLLCFAKMVELHGGKIHLIGYCKATLPKNVIAHGYCSEEQTNSILNNANGFVNLSYRDAAPKVVCQAANVGLPVLYADSGGTKEVVGIGIGIKDPAGEGREAQPPRLRPEAIESSYDVFCKEFPRLKIAALKVECGYQSMLNDYFAILKATANE